MKQLELGLATDSKDVVVDENLTVAEAYSTEGLSNFLSGDVTITACYNDGRAPKRVTKDTKINSLGLCDGDAILVTQNMKSAC